MAPSLTSTVKKSKIHFEFVFGNMLMKNRKIIIKSISYIVIFFILLLLINRLLCFLMLPQVSYFRQTAYDATYEDNIYDVISVGSSDELYTFNSFMANDMLDKSCYNMGTSGTALMGGVYSAFRLVMKHQTPELVIISISINSLQYDEENPIAYAGIAPYTNDFLVNTEYFFRTCMRGGALGRLFPWSVNHSDTLNEVKENITVKTSPLYKAHDPSVLPSESLVYKGLGYCPQLPGENNNNVISYANVNMDDYIDPATGTFYKEKADFDDVQIDTLIKMIDQCHDMGAEVVVNMVPRPRCVLVEDKIYDDGTQIIKEIANEHGADFVDLNMAKPELYDPQPDEYVDGHHVTEPGADRFTKALCDYLLMKKNNTDTSSLFYNTWDEYVEAIDWNIYKGLK